MPTEFEAYLWFAQWLSEAVDWWTAPPGSYRTKHWREIWSSVSILTVMIPAEEASQRRLGRPENLLSHFFWPTPSDGAGFELDSQRQPAMTMYFCYSQGFSCLYGQVKRVCAQPSHLSTKYQETKTCSGQAKSESCLTEEQAGFQEFLDPWLKQKIEWTIIKPNPNEPHTVI